MAGHLSRRTRRLTSPAAVQTPETGVGFPAVLDEKRVIASTGGAHSGALFDGSRAALTNARECRLAGSPWAVTHPGLPRIRTCPIKASGSSGQPFARIGCPVRPPLTTASTAIRRPRVDRGSGLDVPALFPDDGRLTRKPPSLHRLRAGWPVRRLHRYYEALRLLPALRPGLIGFAADLPPCASDASLPGRLAGNRRARVPLGSADPNSRANGGNRQASQVPGEPRRGRAGF